MRIFALTVGVLTGQTVATSWYCYQSMMGIKCDIDPGKNQKFVYDESSNLPSQCSPDGQYCFESFNRDAYPDWWEFTISNNGVECTAWCGPVNCDSGCQCSAANSC